MGESQWSFRIHTKAKVIKLFEPEIQVQVQVNGLAWVIRELRQDVNTDLS